MDLDLIKTVVDEKTIQVVWVGDRVTTDLAYDLKIPGGDQIDLSVTKVKQMMQERGIIFKF
jgi:bifunctional enzyme CysN/CysC